ncbi:hypothetical protein [Campylobacter sp.]|uniref:hypothetical protein n=1 Tax=Campylobacter sp. TaxID=205 RepID=UPI002AA78708|nr:hypothetical protein [Campylobacter sp.]MCI7076859.1 hypothetical protein [Campylobacter sp.]
MIVLLLSPFFILFFCIFLPIFWSLMILSAYRLTRKPYNILLSYTLVAMVGISSLCMSDMNTFGSFWDFFFFIGFIIATPIYLYFFRKIKLNDYKLLFIFSLIITLIILWEMEKPQKMLLYALTKDKTMYDIEIVDELFDGNTTEVRYGFSEEYRQCFKGLASCPILPSFKQLQNQFFTIRDGKKIIVANVYGPYYGSTDLMLYLDTFKDGGGITYEKSFYIDDKKVFQYLRNLKSDNQKSSQKGENNGNN